MRSILALGLVAVGLLSIPTLAAGNSCIPKCETSTAGMVVFVPAVTFVESGSSAVWTSGDGAAHTASATGSFCFHTGSFNRDTQSVLFTVAGGRLFATSTVAGANVPCDSATALPDGTFVQDYVCLAHSNMKAKIIVR